ncbi:FtsQ-type POTRA domain-containing protein [Alteromonas pelagimontana]|uniref:Cell division protein FtsQ n=1 Tax=Alteromonas pelagimontana TaxID=1858656 RepID=A0A6M4MA40_9ALTE|nr:cell division protein FtsQ/DivIB [Alteromonas pelagimontana]QJR80022.1 FtsQ-type POTRA domain-containing protein [Alteromonas pelagimontana]
MSNHPSRTAFWAGVVFLLVVLTALVMGGIKVQAWLQDEQRAPVQVVDFSGEFEHVNVVQLERLIRKSQPGSFFALDVNEVFQLVESQPWIYRASVRKQWPNTLKIYLVEQTPVAQWNEDMLLNPYGETFSASAEGLALPRLFGPSGSEKTALEGYNAMQSLLATTAMPIVELSLSERFAWQIQLGNGIDLNLGRTEFIDRLQRFIDVYPLLAQQPKPVKYVDLRYDTGLAVGWETSTDEQS